MAEERLRIPERLRHETNEIFKLTDPFCEEHLDAEYGVLCRHFGARLARKRPSPLDRGELRIWAGCAIYAVGSINFLFDPSQRPHVTGDDLSYLTGIPKSTLANKAKLIRDTLRLKAFDGELTRQHVLRSNPLAWLVELNGLVVDARVLPADALRSLRRRGIVPDIDPSPDPTSTR